MQACSPLLDAGPDPLSGAQGAANAALTTLLGRTSNSNDSYYRLQQEQCDYAGLPGGTGLESGSQFLANLRYVRTFITHARYDPSIYAPAIPAVLSWEGFAVTMDSSPRPGIARPGWFTVSLPADANDPAMTVEVRFPLYDQSGHEVSVTQPADLASDVQAWLQTP
jgi:hypothetical protein